MPGCSYIGSANSLGLVIAMADYLMGSSSSSSTSVSSVILFSHGEPLDSAVVHRLSWQESSYEQLYVRTEEQRGIFHTLTWYAIDNPVFEQPTADDPSGPVVALLITVPLDN